MCETVLTAVIWDMDGLLLDTERLSFLAWKEGANRLGFKIDETVFHELIGRNPKGIREKLFEILGPAIDLDRLSQVTYEIYGEFLDQEIPLKPGALECTRFLHEHGIPQAVATSSRRSLAERKLGFHGILEQVDTLVTGDEVKHGKPNPEPYLLAASNLGISPQACVAFEDSVNGILSAYTAGMKTVLIPDIAKHGAESMARVWKSYPSLLEAKSLLESLFL